MAHYSPPTIAERAAAAIIIFLGFAGVASAAATRGLTSAPIGTVKPSKTSALTTSECHSLGGVVGAESAACTGAKQFTCKTVTTTIINKRIVVTPHYACIDKR